MKAQCLWDVAMTINASINSSCIALSLQFMSFGNLSLFASYAMLMRPKKAETAVHDC